MKYSEKRAWGEVSVDSKCRLERRRKQGLPHSWDDLRDEAILAADAELKRLREENAEAVKIIMAIVGNGLLKEPEFTALDKRARDFYELRARAGKGRGFTNDQ